MKSFSKFLNASILSMFFAIEHYERIYKKILFSFKIRGIKRYFEKKLFLNEKNMKICILILFL